MEIMKSKRQVNRKLGHVAQFHVCRKRGSKALCLLFPAKSVYATWHNLWHHVVPMNVKSVKNNSDVFLRNSVRKAAIKSSSGRDVPQQFSLFVICVLV